MAIERIENLIRLALSPGIGATGVAKLLVRFGDSDAILGATETQLSQVEGMRSPQIKAVLAAREIDPRPELSAAAEHNVQLISYADADYPAPLLTLSDPPFLLYVKGTLRAEDAQSLGIVGTRNASRYGREQAERFAAGLARIGYTIISGLARGIDTAAHRGALASGGRTIAFVGCGLKHFYPPENRDLCAEISAHGAVVSEFTLDVIADARNFPRRNRLIAGMSLGTLVIEAANRSGSLITARQALEMGRELFVIPGNIDREESFGCNTLIREGATLTRNIEDMLDELPPLYSTSAPKISPTITSSEKSPNKNSDADSAVADRENAEENLAKNRAEKDVKISTPTKSLTESAEIILAKSPPLVGDEALIFNALSADAVHIDDLAESLNLPAGLLLAKLLMLELRGLVTQLPNKNFIRR